MALIDKTEITAEEIAAEGLNALDGKYQKSVGFFAWDFFVALGKVLKDLWDKLFYVCDCLTDLSKMEYSDLVNFVYQMRGIRAKVATCASGELTLVTGVGTIKKSDVFETATGVRFQAISNYDLVEGDKFEVECLESGIIGNVEAGSISIIPTTITGIVAVTNEDAFSNGYEAESKEDLLVRYYEDIQTPITSGNIYHYKKWAKEVTGVGDAKVKPLWNGNNTVKVVIVDANRGVPDKSLVDEVQKYIDPLDNWGCGMGQAPVGAYCTVVGADKKELNIACNIVLKSGVEFDTVKANIQAALMDYFYSAAFNETYVSWAEVGAIIKRTDGVKDYSDLTVNGGSDNVVLTDDNSICEIPVLALLELVEVE